jgi:thioredoxin 1
MTENVTELSSKEFDNFTKEKVVLIDFYADWCMPCLMMAPVIEEIARKFKGKIKFGKVNIEDNQELAQKFRIASLPTFMLFKDGKQANQFVGSRSIEDFEEKLKKYL